MKIGLIGYGRMGREIEQMALERGHVVPLIIDMHNMAERTPDNLAQCDAVIEFTVPASAVGNYLACFEAGVPVVSGTTGWLSHKERVYEACARHKGTFFYASNFSVGVNLFFLLNRKLAEMMASHPAYQAEVSEVHHTRKLDAPSGTAITLAEDLVRLIPGKRGWTIAGEALPEEVKIVPERRVEVPGIHTITWESEDDLISVTHSAKNRRGFALGAVLAAEFCLTHHGILSMNDMLKF